MKQQPGSPLAGVGILLAFLTSLVLWLLIGFAAWRIYGRWA